MLTSCIGIALVFFSIGIFVGVTVFRSLGNISISDYSYADPYVEETESESEEETEI